MRVQDIAQGMLDLIEETNLPENIDLAEPDWLEQRDLDALTEIAAGREPEPEEWDDLVDAVVEGLSPFCSPFCYVGASVGDGADFGVWFDSYNLADRLSMSRAAGTVTLADGSVLLVDEELIVTINDHGNVTIQRLAKGETLVEAV